MVSATDEWRFPAMEFVNDPVIACGERVPFAWRSSAGTAYGWDPATGDLEDLLAFLGEGFSVINGKLYWAGADGTLRPQITDRPGAWVRWLTTEPLFIHIDHVLHEGCVVRGDVDHEAVAGDGVSLADQLAHAQEERQLVMARANEEWARANDAEAKLADAQAELVEAMREIADRDGRIAELEADLRLNDETQTGSAAGQRVNMSPDLVDEAKIGASAFDLDGLHAEAVASLALDGQTFDVGPVTVLSPDADTAQGTPIIPRPEPKPKGGKSKPAPSLTEG